MEVDKLRERIEREIDSIEGAADLERVRASILGRKGLFSSLFEKIKELPLEERKREGRELNRLKEYAEARLNELRARFEKRGEASRLDITLPGKRPLLGTTHPITAVLDEILEIFSSMGFTVVEGPDIESEYYNFEALNIPAFHPARDMQDTFYLEGGLLLRTHTSPMEVRVMEAQDPPVRIVSPGAVYRHDQDISHTPMFHQVEGLMVEEGVSFSDLKGVLTIFVEEMFGKKTPLRFRPSYFPFTEPSAELDIGCAICKGSGCRVCKGTGWIEILGCGMSHPQVLRNVHYDPERVSGFAFGLGVERIAMIRFGIDDIRHFYNNDLRFLSQF